MSDFLVGFLKVAEEEKNRKRWLAPLAGIGAAAGVYGALRRGKGRVTRTSTGVAPEGHINKFLHRLAYGAEDVRYLGDGKDGFIKAPKKPIKVKGHVLYDQAGDAAHVKGDKSIGDVSNRKEYGLEDKLHESRRINRAAPELHAKTTMFQAKGKKELRRLHERFDGKEYYIKPRHGQDSGVGGGGLIHSNDVHNYLNGYTTGEKASLIRATMKNPRKNIIQHDMGLSVDKKSRYPREIRVHAIGGKVVRGTSSVRGNNTADSKHLALAEEAVQKMLDKSPARHKKNNYVIGADVGLTKGNQPKIIELNEGAASSGFLDPTLMSTKGVGGFFTAVKNNNKIYRHLTGKHSQLASGLRAVGAGTATAGGVALTQNALEKRQTPPLAPLQKAAAMGFWQGFEKAGYDYAHEAGEIEREYQHAASQPVGSLEDRKKNYRLGLGIAGGIVGAFAGGAAAKRLLTNPKALNKLKKSRVIKRKESSLERSHYVGGSVVGGVGGALLGKLLGGPAGESMHKAKLQEIANANLILSLPEDKRDALFKHKARERELHQERWQKQVDRMGEDGRHRELVVTLRGERR